MAAVMEHVARASRLIPATPAECYRAWTEPAILTRWFCPGEMSVQVHELELEVGGRFRMEMQDADGTPHIPYGEYLELVPDERITMTWQWAGGTFTDSVVTVTFTAEGDGTRVDIVHEKLPDAARADAHTEGWGGCLENMEALFA